MLPKDITILETPVVDQESSESAPACEEMITSKWSRSSYFGTLLINIGAFILPALYSTLNKLWVANIDSSMVVTTDAYTLAAGRLEHTIGLLLSIVIAAAAQSFANAFVPAEVREVSFTYVRIAAFSALSTTIETAVAAATRALDQPDVPLIISCVKFAVNIILDMILISKFHVRIVNPSANLQAATQLACGMSASLIGLAYFIRTTKRQMQRSPVVRSADSVRPTFRALKTLARPGAFTFTESAVRNALYLWLVSGIVAMGLNYATAWGVFNTIRWGLIMVPVQALEATSLAFIGHAWGSWRRSVGTSNRRPVATRRDLLKIARPALISCLVGLVVEVPLCLFMSFYGARRFAFFISESERVAVITETMWKTIDWCYIFYALSTQLATILLATRPVWYLYQSLISNICWVLPWAIAISKIGITPNDARKYQSIVFGGSLVFSFFDILLVVLVWAWKLVKGKMTVPLLSSVRLD